MKSYKLFFSVLAVSIMAASCSSDQGSNLSPGNAGGQGGSMARFAVNGNTMYVLSGDSLRVLDISDNHAITPLKSMASGNGVETLYPRGNALFMGTENGMNIFDITDPIEPVWLSTFSHIRSCDPVVADDKYAYVSLRSGNSRCWR